MCVFALIIAGKDVSEFDNLLKNEALEKQKADEDEARRKEELEKKTEKEIAEIEQEVIKETPDVIEEETDEEEEEEIKIDDSNKIITLRKQIEDQKSL